MVTSSRHGWPSAVNGSSWAAVHTSSATSRTRPRPESTPASARPACSGLVNACPPAPSAAMTSAIRAASPGPSASRPTVTHTIPPRKRRRTLRSAQARAASVVFPKPPAPTRPVVSATGPDPLPASADTTSASSARSTQPAVAGTKDSHASGRRGGGPAQENNGPLSAALTTAATGSATARRPVPAGGHRNSYHAHQSTKNTASAAPTATVQRPAARHLRWASVTSHRRSRPESRLTILGKDCPIRTRPGSMN